MRLRQHMAGRGRRPRVAFGEPSAVYFRTAWLGAILGGVGWLVLGCRERLGPEDLGTIVERPEDFPGHGEPYPLPQLDAPLTPEAEGVGGAGENSGAVAPP